MGSVAAPWAWGSLLRASAAGKEPTRDADVCRDPGGHRRLIEDDSVRVVHRGRRGIDLGRPGTDERYRPRHLLEHVREVLGAHDRSRQEPGRLLADSLP